MSNKPSSWPPQPHRSARLPQVPTEGEPFDWAVTLTSVVIVPATDDQATRVVDELAVYGAAVSVGLDRISVTMSAHGANVADSLHRSLQLWGQTLLEAGVAAGIAVAAEVIARDEQDRPSVESGS